MRTTFADALSAGSIVLDGGLATRLEARGHDLRSDLWSARLLRDDPDEVVGAHRDFFAAGAQVAIAASYQASFEGFGHLGLDRSRAAALMTRSVELARRARDESAGDRDCWVAASIGPYGAVLADGSEYRGDYGLSVSALRAWHRPRLAILMDAGADLLAVETIPAAAEVEALLAEIAGSGVPAWISLTCAGGRTRAGEPVDEVFAMAADVSEVVAVGVNCCRPGEVAELVAAAVRASGKPGLAYPNSGETWDATARTWHGPSGFDTAEVNTWRAAGARAIGGCCRVGVETIAAIRDQLG